MSYFLWDCHDLLTPLSEWNDVGYECLVVYIYSHVRSTSLMTTLYIRFKVFGNWYGVRSTGIVIVIFPTHRTSSPVCPRTTPTWHGSSIIGDLLPPKTRCSVPRFVLAFGWLPIRRAVTTPFLGRSGSWVICLTPICYRKPRPRETP